MIVQFEKVTKRFGTRTILDGLDLTIQAGETFVLLGRSGIGKSVCLRHIVGLLRADAGRVLVFDKDVTKLKEREMNAHRRRLGYLFQDGALINWLTIEDNVALPLRERGKQGRDEALARTRECLALVELEAHAHKFPKEISGGMRKRAGLARALVARPEVVLYDEPTSGLDPISSSVINELINNLKRKFQITQLVVTHDMASVFAIADRVGLLHEGRLHAIGTVDEIRNSPSPAVQQFLRGDIVGPLTDKDGKA
ncbi:MAG: ABC transporter ATP-binding protein [Planctomycetota bacterium]